MQTLTERAGYMPNNLFVKEVQEQKAEALAQLAEATNSGRATVSKLASNNSQLMNQVANMTIKTSTLQHFELALKN
eukprot:13260223-Ditylum_brightwellii.AAC.1